MSMVCASKIGIGTGTCPQLTQAILHQEDAPPSYHLAFDAHRSHREKHTECCAYSPTPC